MGQIRHKIEKIKSTFKKCFRIVICNCLQYVLVCVLLCGLLLRRYVIFLRHALDVRVASYLYCTHPLEVFLRHALDVRVASMFNMIMTSLKNLRHALDVRVASAKMH